MKHPTIFIAIVAVALFVSQAPAQVVLQGLPQPKGKQPEIEKLEAELNRLAEALQGRAAQPRRPADNAITWGGMRLNKADANLRQQLGLDENEGLVVAGVDPNSPADKAGVKANDVLVKINDKSVPSEYEAFQKVVKDQKVDQAADLVVVRQGKEQTLKGAKMPALVQNARPNGGAGRPGMGGLGGLGGIGGFQLGRLPNPLQGNVENFHLEMTVNGVKTMQKYDNEKYAGEYSKDGLKITIAGKMQNGRPSQPDAVTVTEGKETKKYDALKDVPVQHRIIAQQLMPTLSSINRLMLMPALPNLQNFPGLPVIPDIDD
jgi:membrane-associated protease RseP (regulator of RpoE activity)